MSQEIQQIFLMVAMTALAIAVGFFIVYKVEKSTKKER